MENFLIKEEFKASDSLRGRGFVFCYDEEGKLVFSKENMIVLTGRQFIMQNSLSPTSFLKVLLGTESKQAEPSDDISSMGTTIEASNKLTIADTTFYSKFEEITTTENKIKASGINVSLGDNNYFQCSVNVTDLVAKFLIVFNSTESIGANSLGLVSSDGKLFSRVVFPTYYKSPNQRLTFKYYIYF